MNDNRLLRRADWRYLLANPSPEKSICFSDGILRQAVENISSSLVDADDSSAGQCDLAVALNPTSAVLRSALDVLRTGGEIYTEWNSQLVVGAQGVRHRLEQIGFTDVVCYWAWSPPMVAPSLFWLPLDSSEAFRYFLKTRPPTASITARMARFVLRKIVALGLQSRLLMPVCAIARKPTFDKQDSFQSQINTEILSRRANGNGDQPSRLSWMLWTPGYRSINKIAAFVFSEADEKPSMVVKIPRSDSSTQALAAEVHNLTQLSNREKSFTNSVPSILFTFDWKGWMVAAQPFVAGSPIYTSLNKDSYPELAHKVTDWLIALASDAIPSARIEWWDRLVGSAIKGFSQRFGLVFDTHELNCIQQALNKLDNLPIVFEQRDCSPWNVFMNEEGEIRVLDWESSEPSGLPAPDLIYFLTYLSFFVEGAMESKEYLKAYQKAFDSQTAIGMVNRDCLEKYCAAINLNTSVLKPLRLLTWLIHSRAEYQRLVEDSTGNPTRSALEASLFSTLVREEIRNYAELNG